MRTVRPLVDHRGKNMNNCVSLKVIHRVLPNPLEERVQETVLIRDWEGDLVYAKSRSYIHNL